MVTRQGGGQGMFRSLFQRGSERLTDLKVRVMRRAGRWLQPLARLHPDFWFPHGVLALILVLLGIHNTLPLMEQIRLLSQGIIRYGPVEDFHHLPEFFHQWMGSVRSLIGLLQILMSIGLLFRSRFAWGAGIALSSAAFLILFRQNHGHLVLPAIADLILFIGLLIFRKTFSRSNIATGTMFSLLSIILLFSYAVFGSFLLGMGFNPPIKTLLTAFYYSVVTMSTVGYGDIVPVTDDARMFTVSIIILGISIFTASLSTVILPLVNERVQHLLMGENKVMIRSNHYILVGTGGLAMTTYEELVRRNLPVTMIVAGRKTGIPWDGIDQVEGDPMDPETLKEAGIMQASAILSLLDDDSENAFVILSARETGSVAKTVVSVRDRTKLARIRTVHPDMILSTDAIGGELLAMALTGEPVNGQEIIERIFPSRPGKGTNGASEG